MRNETAKCNAWLERPKMGQGKESASARTDGNRDREGLRERESLDNMAAAGPKDLTAVFSTSDQIWA